MIGAKAYAMVYSKGRYNGWFKTRFGVWAKRETHHPGNEPAFSKCSAVTNDWGAESGIHYMSSRRDRGHASSPVMKHLAFIFPTPWPGLEHGLVRTE